MEKKQFKKILKENLEGYGFSYVNKAFYYEKDELVIVISTQKSNYENSYYINFGFKLKDLNGQSYKYPKDSECDTFGRFTFCSGDKPSGLFDLNKLTDEDFSSMIREYFNKNIKLVIEEGLAKYYELNPKALVTASPKVKRVLGL